MIEKIPEMFEKNSEKCKLISLFPWIFAAIAFKKRSFRKYFDTEANYLWFYQTIARLFQAPTMEIATLLQSNLVFELLHRAEGQAGGLMRLGLTNTAITLLLQLAMLETTNLQASSLGGSIYAAIL